MVAILLLSIVPHDDVIRESCDLMELNHFYDEQGRLVFDQVIFWQWDEDRYNVRAWRLIKTPSSLPVREQRSSDWVATWLDGDATRQVRASSYRETWTQYDPELLEREKLPKEFRRELRQSQRKVSR